MKKSRVKLRSSILLALCIVVIGVVGVIGVKAAEEVALPDVMYEAGVTYEKDDEAPTTVPTGYLFAGWYENIGTEETPNYSPVKEPTIGATYVAKYVPAQVLGIRAQVTKNIIDNEELDNLKNNAIRFVTSLDSTNYEDIGFDISIGGVTQDTAKHKTNIVYEVIYAIGATNTDDPWEYKPSEVFENAASRFFKTYTFTSVPEGGFDTDIVVRPYYITYDGTKVYGTQAIKTVNYCRAWVYVDSASTVTEIGTHNSPFKTIEAAVAVMDENTTQKTGLDPKVILKSDITLNSQVLVDKTLTLTSKGERKTISRIANMKSSDAMVYVQNKEQTINVTVDNIRFDGTGTNTNIRALAVGRDGQDDTLNINHTLIENFTSIKQGSSLMVRGTVNFTDSTIQKGSSTKEGGLVCVDSGKFTMEGGTIVNGSSSINGGCIYGNEGAEIHIKGGTIQEGTATQYGGNIYVNKASLTLLEQTTISGGVAQDNGGSMYLDLGENTFTMTDSTVIGGESKNNGGNIYAVGTSKSLSKIAITGSYIEDGTAISSTVDSNSAGTGGNIYIDCVAMDVTNTTISGGQAPCSRGGNVYVRSNSVLSLNTGSIVESGDAYKNGGNVMLNSSSHMQVVGGTVQNGTAETGQGGNVFVSTDSSITVKDGSFLGGTSKGEGANILLSAATSEFELAGGKVEITGGKTNNGVASNLYLPYFEDTGEQTGITITGKLEDGTTIGIKPFVGACEFASGDGVTEDCTSYFTPDVDGMEVECSDSTLSLAFSDDNKPDNYLNGTNHFVPVWTSERIVPERMLDFDEKYEQFFKPDGRLMSVAHRGDWKHYPECSAEAFLSAIMSGADIVEVDVAKTADGKFVVMHDETLNRTTNVDILRTQGVSVPTSNYVENWTYAQLCQLRLRQGDGGSNDLVTNSVIPTLKEVIKLCYGRVFITLDKDSRFEWTDIQAIIEDLVTEGYDRAELYRTVMLPYTKTGVSYSTSNGVINDTDIDSKFDKKYTSVAALLQEIEDNAGAESALMSRAFLNNDYAKYNEDDENYNELYNIAETNLATTLSYTAKYVKQFNFPLVLRCNEYAKRFTDTYRKVNVDGTTINVLEQFRVHIECLHRNDYLEMWQQIDTEGYGIIVTNDICGLTEYIQEKYLPGIVVDPNPLPKPGDDSQTWP